MTGKSHAKESAPAKAAKLPQAEIQGLADKGLKAWETGVPDEAADSASAVWRFEQVRDPSAHLEISRTDVDGATHGGSLYGAEFGVEPEQLRARLVSVVLAVANPV